MPVAYAGNPRRFVVALCALAAVCLAGSRSVAAPTDFTVAFGQQKFRLSEARGRYVALHFLMKAECPNCIAFIREYARRGSEVAGVVHVFLKADGEPEIESFVGRLRAAGVKSARVFRDPDARLAAEYEIPNGYEFQGESVHYPALVLLGPDGREVFRQVGKSNADRLSFDAFARKVAELTRTSDIGQYNLADKRIAIQGYDPVTYVESSRADKGREDLRSEFRDVTYHFSTPQNRERFAAAPDRYVPAYGGWCATAMAEGRKVEIDPTNFKVTNGRLLLFYKGWLGNALKEWNRDEPGLMKQADEQWKRIAPGDASAPSGARP